MSYKFISTGLLLRRLREEKDLRLREIAGLLGMDISLLSKIERGERKPNKDQIRKLAQVYNVENNYLMIHYLSEIIYSHIADEECASEALKAAERKVINNN